MNLTYIKEDNLIDLKSNIKSTVDKYALPDNSWLKEYFGVDPLENSKYTVEDFVLDMSHEKPFYTDSENVMRVYNRLKFLSDSQASDERLWAGLCLGPFWRYTQYRWAIDEKSTEKNVEQHFFFGFGARRSLTRNALSRLWWIGRLTYDEERKDPYVLTKYVCENQDIILHTLERNISNNKEIIIPFLSAIIDARKEGLPINTDRVGELAKYLNLLGGVYILDVLDRQVIYDKVLTKSREMSKEI